MAEMNTNMVQNGMKEQVFDSYTWRTFTSVCTGKPEYNKYFPRRDYDDEGNPLEEPWAQFFETRVAVNGEDGSVQWYRIRFYGELADKFNAKLSEEGKVARMNCQGYVRTRTYTDERDGMEKVVPFTVIPDKLDNQGNYAFFKVEAIWKHARGANGEDPFAAAEGRAATDQTADGQEEAERAARADEVREQNRVEAHAQEGVEEVSPEEFGFGSHVLDESDAPF